jgi:F-type H+-transporting ATPase subunit gamma
MPNLKEVRIRITSVRSTQQITKAMKMVSASKLRRAQDAIQRMRPYANKLRDILQNVSSSLDQSVSSGYTASRPVKKVLLVVVTSNRGLCGAFNSNVIKAANRLLADKYAAQHKAGNVKVLCIGKKASDNYSKSSALYAGNHNELFANPSFENAVRIVEGIMNDYTEGVYDRVEVIYNQFKNAVTQVVTAEQLLPVAPDESVSITGPKADYIYEPSQAEIVNNLIPLSIKTQFYKAILDSHASEHGARMTSMSKATDNAQEMIKSLRITYNKARQAAITKEIIEIVSGAEALN